IARIFFEVEQFDEAELYYREALLIGKTLLDDECVSLFTGNLAELALKRGQCSEAERLANEALKLAEKIGRKDAIADNCSLLAKSLSRQGRAAEGFSYAKRAVAIFTELRAPELIMAQALLD